jgi:hypothetical protein
MSNTIQIKRSSTTASVPTAGQLAVGELAVNLADKRLFTKDASDAVISLTPVSDAIKSITASVASNALTVTLNPTTLDFRSATLGSGTVNTRTIATAISVVVPSGATLGTTNAVLSKVTLIALDNAGTVELAVCNGSLSLDESALISTTALSVDSDSASVVYSTTARTNVPFRVVGFVESTQSTAGTWASAPSKIQGAGGQALQAGKGITSATAVTASGTSVDFTSIPSWVKRITVMFSGVSTNGSSIPLVQLGASGGIETTGYSGQGNSFITSGGASNVVTTTANTVGFNLSSSISTSASTDLIGTATITNITGNSWVLNSFNSQSSGNSGAGTGAKTLSATLDRIRIATVNGTDAFDAGTINILMEG